MNEILRRMCVLACCAAMAFAVSACGDDPGAENDARKNCGNEVCTESQDCVDDRCVDKAKPDELCEDDKECGKGQVCLMGACVDDVPEETVCNGITVNILNDSANCGRCGEKCAVGHMCLNGACLPGIGETFCDGSAVNTSNDPANCGQCGRTAALQICKDGDFIPPSAGEIVTFGNYNGAPIQWYVLDNDTINHRIMVLAMDTLEKRPYNTERVNTIWAESTLRSWLNGYSAGENKQGEDYTSSNFISTSFTNEERAWIVQTTVVNEDNSEKGTRGGMNTWDWVFLLSISEVNTLLGKKNEDICSKIHCNSSWWLRTLGGSVFDAASVNNGGNIDYSGMGVDSDLGVRPALWLNYEKPRPEDPCEAVVCLAEQACIHARCIDNACLENGVEKVCDAGQVCSKGACVDEAPEETVCDGKSVNTSNDSANCGQCGQKCAVGYMCVNGSCLSGSGVTYCNGRNVNTSNDPVNCGQCGRTATHQICKEGDFIAPAVGEIISFGTYNGTPIQWYILDNDTTNHRIMLTSMDILESRPYHIVDEGVTWAVSTIRSWLNGYGSGENIQEQDYTSSSFISTAFIDEERERIDQITVVNEDSPKGTKGGEDTLDWVFLLSISEVNTLLGKVKGDIGSKLRCASAWWLRTPGSSTHHVAVVSPSWDYSGNIDESGLNIYNNYGVRPALWLNY